MGFEPPAAAQALRKGGSTSSASNLCLITCATNAGSHGGSNRCCQTLYCIGSLLFLRSLLPLLFLSFSFCGAVLGAPRGPVGKHTASWQLQQHITLPELCVSSRRRRFVYMTPAGLEPAIPGSVGRCLIHWATGPRCSRMHVDSIALKQMLKFLCGA